MYGGYIFFGYIYDPIQKWPLQPIIGKNLAVLVVLRWLATKNQSGFIFLTFYKSTHICH